MIDRHLPEALSSRVDYWGLLLCTVLGGWAVFSLTRPNPGLDRACLVLAITAAIYGLLERGPSRWWASASWIATELLLVVVVAGSLAALIRPGSMWAGGASLLVSLVLGAGLGRVRGEELEGREVPANLVGMLAFPRDIWGRRRVWLPDFRWTMVVTARRGYACYAAGGLLMIVIIRRLFLP